MHKFYKALAAQVQMFRDRKGVATGFAVGSMLAAGAANAAVDTSTIVGFCTDAGAAIAVIGVAVLGVLYGKKTFNWLRPN